MSQTTTRANSIDAETPVSRFNQHVMAWCGVGFVILFGAGMLIAGFIPPPSPDKSADQIAEQYRDDANLIRTGTLLMLVATGLLIPFFAVVVLQMRRISGSLSGWCLASLIAAAVTTWVVTLPPLVLAVTAFRPEVQAPSVVQGFNDFAWFLFLMNFPAVSVFCVIIGAAIFTDRSEVPVFPRWLGYFHIWCAIAFAPGGFLTYVKTGPIAWDGLISFWLAAIFFFGWLLVLAWATARAIEQDPSTEPRSAVSASTIGSAPLG